MTQVEDINNEEQKEDEEKPYKRKEQKEERQKPLLNETSTKINVNFKVVK